VLSLWFALKHPDIPFWAKIIAFVAVAYALSPVDLIPDFIPVLGYLDDLIIVPVLVWLALKLIPIDAMNQAKDQAVEWINSNKSKPTSYVGLLFVLIVWAMCLIVLLNQLSLSGNFNASFHISFISSSAISGAATTSMSENSSN
jgi:uncharacterized membrane protein YkvA (DUF1232 family)